MSDSIGSNYRPCDNAPQCTGEGTKWIGMGTFNRECLCVPCYDARRRGQRTAPAVDPIAEAERLRLATAATVTIARATESSRAEAEENERRELEAQKSRHARRISTAAPIVHPKPPVAPTVPRPAPKAATVAPAAPEPSIRLTEYVRSHNGCTIREATTALRMGDWAIRVAVKRLRDDGVLAQFDPSVCAQYGRLYLIETAPSAPPKNAPRVPTPPRLLAWVRDGHNGARQKDAASALGVNTNTINQCVIKARASGIFDPRREHYHGRIFLAGTTPEYLPPLLKKCQPRPFDILPPDQRIPGQCARVGCVSTKIHARGICRPDHNAAVKLGILDSLPVTPRATRIDCARVKIATFIQENPGRTISEIADTLRLNPQTVAKYVCMFRRDGSVAPSNGLFRGHDTRVWLAGMAPKKRTVKDEILLHIHAENESRTSDLVKRIPAHVHHAIRALRMAGLIASPRFNVNVLTSKGAEYVAALLKKQG